MTQMQKILSLLNDNEGEFLTFAEMYEELKPIAKGSLSGNLAMLSRDGYVQRRLRVSEDGGRDLQEYEISPEGARWLEESLSKPSRRRRSRRVRVQSPAPALTSTMQAPAETPAAPPAAGSFSAVARAAEVADEFQHLRKFADWLTEQDAMKKAAGANTEGLILNYLGVDPAEFAAQREQLQSLLASFQ